MQYLIKFYIKLFHMRTVTLRHVREALPPGFSLWREQMPAYLVPRSHYFFLPNMTAHKNIAATFKPNMAAFLSSGGEAIYTKGSL